MQGDGTVAFYFPGLQRTSNVKPFYVLLLPLQHHVVNIQLTGGPMVRRRRSRTSTGDPWLIITPIKNCLWLCELVKYALKHIRNATDQVCNSALKHPVARFYYPDCVVE